VQKAANAKSQYADWNSELQQKLRELREEKKGWILEAATLRSKEHEILVGLIFFFHIGIVCDDDGPRF